MKQHAAARLAHGSDAALASKTPAVPPLKTQDPTKSQAWEPDKKTHPKHFLTVKAKAKAEKLMKKVRARSSSSKGFRRLMRLKARLFRRRKPAFGVESSTPARSESNEAEGMETQTTELDPHQKRKKPDLLNEDDACDIAIMFGGSLSYWVLPSNRIWKKKKSQSIMQDNNVDMNTTTSNSGSPSTIKSDETYIFEKKDT